MYLCERERSACARGWKNKKGKKEREIGWLRRCRRHRCDGEEKRRNEPLPRWERGVAFFGILPSVSLTTLSQKPGPTVERNNWPRGGRGLKSAATESPIIFRSLSFPPNQRIKASLQGPASVFSNWLKLSLPLSSSPFSLVLSFSSNSYRATGEALGDGTMQVHVPLSLFSRVFLCVHLCLDEQEVDCVGFHGHGRRKLATSRGVSYEKVEKSRRMTIVEIGSSQSSSFGFRS